MAIIIELLVETLSKGTHISTSTEAPQARVETSQHQLPVWVWEDMEEFLEVSPHFSANSLPGPQMVRKNISSILLVFHELFYIFTRCSGNLTDNQHWPGCGELWGPPGSVRQAWSLQRPGLLQAAAHRGRELERFLYCNADRVWCIGALAAARTPA